jgi:hypothetical protein
MTKFSVTGNSWKTEIEVDDSIYEKYGDMAMEAMTQAFDKWHDGELGEDAELGFIMTAVESGFENDPNKEMVCLSALVAENAENHAVASEMRQAMKIVTDNGYGSYE